VGYHLVPHLKAQIEELAPLMAFRTADSPPPAEKRGQDAYQKNDDSNAYIDGLLSNHKTLLCPADDVALQLLFIVYSPYGT
jgi:hypothetical protein